MSLVPIDYLLSGNEVAIRIEEDEIFCLTPDCILKVLEPYGSELLFSFEKSKVINKEKNETHIISVYSFGKRYELIVSMKHGKICYEHDDKSKYTTTGFILERYGELFSEESRSFEKIDLVEAIKIYPQNSFEKP